MLTYLKIRNLGFLRTLLPLLLITLPACARSAPYTPREGDLIFQTSQSAQSLAIQRATNSPLSHMGIIAFKDGAPYVFEAVGPVKYTALREWIARGVGHRFAVRRLRDASSVLTPAALTKIRLTEQTFIGKPYDLTFEWSNDRIYCSELAWKIYRDALGVEIGTLQKLREFDLNDPAVKQKLKERYGNAVPLDETVISPAAIFESEALVTVGTDFSSVT